MDEQEKLPGDAMSLIFWGLIVQLLDFNVFGLDIFPDLLGAVLILIGLGRLAEAGAYFRKSRNVYLASVPCLFLDTIKCAVPIDHTAAQIFAYTSIGIHFAALYLLCKGIQAAAENTGHREIAESVKRRYQMYFALLLLSCFLFLIPSLAAVGIILLAIVYVCLLSLIYQAKATL